MGGNKCGYLIVAVILATIGFWLLVSGFVMQWADSMSYMSMGYYFVGFLLCGIAMMLKHKSCCAPIMK